jgi:hypothetical protein
MKAIIIAVVVTIGMVVILQTRDTLEYVSEPVEIMEVEVTPTEEELRRLEWEREAEEVRQQHIRVRELEHQAEVLRGQRKELDEQIKAIELELGTH